ncbi:phage capsid protein [Heyndrickxia shackletonii]|uniref:Phage capsid protein n=1 Tax=Heyndrickxia shackletonii TaxID=157838 RepID=A0A0Q3WYX6_9BACI|nr:phage major capsid protein [Heyndrickxia shackletonii]KQL54515.1 phage capsid protein [Heyndrickxia shackletonii]NEY99247.1 phage major capsid protein [Heyndrickxia shackletonii]
MRKMLTEKKIEVRSMPSLVEQRNNLLDEMDGIMAKVKEETRAMDDNENKRFDEIKAEIAKIDKTLAAEAEARSYEKKETKKQDGKEEQRALEEANFLKYIRGEERALDVGSNGGIIPTHIANKIIEKVKELSPIYSMATVFNVGGDLVFPVYDENTSSIGAAYVDDMQELTEGTGKFTTVKLENFIIGSLAKISKSLMNRTDIDLLSFVINKVAKAIAEFLEKELINGTDGKLTGILSSTYGVESASSTALTADELIDLQMTVPEVFQANASWILNKDTFKAVRKLKDSEGNYLLNKDLTTQFGWSLLGKPVYVTESMPKIAAGAKVIAYGDMSGLYVKLAQNVELQVLVEKYATQHAVGVVGYVEADSEIVEPQKLAVLTMKAS